MMLNRSVAVFLCIAALSTIGCKKVTIYEGEGQCQNCTLAVDVETNNYFCTSAAALADLNRQCAAEKMQLVKYTISDREVPDTGQCDPAVKTWPPLSEMVSPLAAEMGRSRTGKTVTLDDTPECPSTVDLKVTVYYDVGHSFCPNAPKEFQVRYGKVGETVKLLEDVPAGGNHEFICTDAAVTNGKVSFISIYAENGCSCIDLEHCATISVSVSDIPADGSRVEIHANLNTFTLTPTIIPPPDADAIASAPSVVPSSVRRELLPIPDPMFTPRGR